jgi:pilus assembly protein Flp/PilA
MTLKGLSEYSLKRALRAFLADDSGATAIEYGLIATMIAVVCIGAFKKVAGSNTGGWQGVATKVGAASGP